MNPFNFESSDKEVVLNISDVNSQKIGKMFNQGKRLLTINDFDYNDRYQIRLEKSSALGLSGMCFLNRKASYQADFNNGSEILLVDVINAIAGGKII